MAFSCGRPKASLPASLPMPSPILPSVSTYCRLTPGISGKLLDKGEGPMTAYQLFCWIVTGAFLIFPVGHGIIVGLRQSIVGEEQRFRQVKRISPRQVPTENERLRKVLLRPALAPGSDAETLLRPAI